MALSYLRRLMALAFARCASSFEATLPNGGRVHVWPGQRVVLPVISGGAPEENEGGEKGKEGEKDEGGKEGGSGKEGGGKEETDDQKAEREKAERVEEDDDWKTKSRKNETRAKRAERELKEEREKREAREETEKSEHEKALEKAKKEGRAEVEIKAAQERKADRLEVSVTRLAGRKLTVGDGDDAEEVRFADPEDALMHVERAISRDEIDAEDIFDKDGRVDSDALQKELVELLERKPHLRESTGSGKTPEPKKGDPDTRKGDPADGSLEGMSAEDHAKRKYGDPAAKGR
jgi:hypothetical protein